MASGESCDAGDWDCDLPVAGTWKLIDWKLSKEDCRAELTPVLCRRERHTHTHLQTHTHMHSHMGMYAHTDPHTLPLVQITQGTYVQTNTHAHGHTDTHTHTHSLNRLRHARANSKGTQAHTREPLDIAHSKTHTHTHMQRLADPQIHSTDRLSDGAKRV